MRVLAKHKYRARRVAEDGYNFDSQREHARYRELKLLTKTGAIHELEVHPRFEIVWPGRLQRICFVEMDFHYIDRDGTTHVEDVKGYDTAMSKLKRKLVKAAHGIEVEIVK